MTIIIELLCILCAVILAMSAEDKKVWILVIVICLLCVIPYICNSWYNFMKKMGSTVFGVFSLYYFLTTVIPYVAQNDSCLKGMLANLTIPRVAAHNDMWISPILEGKVVNLTYATPWCWDYMEKFAKDSVTEDREVQQFYQIIWGNVSENELLRVGGIDFVGTRSLYAEAELNYIADLGSTPTLFLDVNNLVETEMVYIITDDNYNIYMLSTEMVERILDENEA